MPFWKNKLALALIVSVFFSLLIGLGLFFQVFNGWQLQLADNLYTGRTLRSDIIIVTIDDQTLSSSGLGDITKWDFSNFEKVLENINKHSPKVVAFDAFFKNSKTPDSDEAFKEQLSKTNNPVIMFRGDPDGYDPKGYYVQTPQSAFTEKPLALFLEPQNVTAAIANVLPDQDNIIRKIFPTLFSKKYSEFDENFPFAIARIALGGVSAKTPDISPGNYNLSIQNNQHLNIPLEQGQMLINYASLAGKKSYTNISFLDVYKENYKDFNNDPDNLFKDKIVLIGPTAFFFKDEHYTPTSKTYSMTGVEIHANALQTILDQKFLRNLSFPEKAIIILILAFTAAFTFMFTKIRYSLIYLFGVPLAYSLAAKPVFDNGIILDLVHPYLTVIVTFIAVYLYRYVTEFREKIALQSAFGKYVNPALVKQITEHPEALKLGGESRDITVMFTDIAHSTTIEEKLKPQSVVTLLSEYFQAMSQVIMEEGGTVDKFEGDGIMALFGAPVSQTDHAVRAARAALKMRVKLIQLLEKWKTDPPLPGGEPKPQIDFRCGMSSGEAIVGNMGSTERFDYTALGDVVNLGARLESQNKEYETHIMMSEKTRDLIKEQFETRQLDIIQVMGKTEPVKVFELLASKGELPADKMNLLKQYNEAIEIYYARKFKDAHAIFTEILKADPNDGPTKLFVERSEIYSNFPPSENWDGVSKKNLK